MGGVVGIVAQVAMPLVSKLLGGGLGDMLSKVFNFGDMFKGIFGDTEDRANGTSDKANEQNQAATKARQDAENFLRNPNVQPPAPKAIFIA
jgi:hypothetical protein